MNQLNKFQSRSKVINKRGVSLCRSIAVGRHPLTSWLEKGGMDSSLKHVDIMTEGDRERLIVSKAGGIRAGELIFSVPAAMCITLDRIFRDSTVSELLANGKLSEIAILALFLCYEKKTMRDEGKESPWREYILSLDKSRARGNQSVESPLLWSDSELNDLLAGSSIISAVKERKEGIRAEYQQLDSVWWLASSLFETYPFDMPSLVFPFEVFLSAFVAVQGSILHLRGEGVGPGKRFALCPLGPPLIRYSSTSKALISYNASKEAVELVADKDYAQGDHVVAWCGPQPNSRLLINYGIVEEGENPFDKLQVTITIPSQDPLFRAKRLALQPHSLSTQQVFDLSVRGLSPTLLPWLRLALATDEDQVNKVRFPPAPSRGPGTTPPPSTPPEPSPTENLDPNVEKKIADLLSAYIARRLSGYKASQKVGSSDQHTARQLAASRLIAAEKRILDSSLHSLQQSNPDPQAIDQSILDSSTVVFS